MSTFETNEGDFTLEVIFVFWFVVRLVPHHQLTMKLDLQILLQFLNTRKIGARIKSYNMGSKI